MGIPTFHRHIYAKERSLLGNFAAIIRENCLFLNRKLRNIFRVATSLTVYLLLTAIGGQFLKHLFSLPQSSFPTSSLPTRSVLSLVVVGLGKSGL
ncbi:MAG TPA: hypothetical protein DCQ32_01005 [Cyanobacteria bacterium UBA8156]|nr:hypothetical protein [Cyanobacteria bacterium UBA8156]